MVTSILPGCLKKEPIVNKEPTPVDIFEQKIKNSDQSTQTDLYNLLSASERMQIWKNHFRRAADFDFVRGNNNKVSIIRELDSRLKTLVFEKGSREHAIFLSFELPTWMERARKEFSAKELYEIAYDVRYSSFDETIPPPAGSVDCFCHVGNSGYSCKKWSFGFPSGISVEYGICENNGPCSGGNSGCGALWLESCNGQHCNF